MSGDLDSLLRVVALQAFMVVRLARIPHVSNIRSSLTLEPLSDRTALPIGLL